MPRRIFLKETNTGNSVPGFTTISVNTEGKVVRKGSDQVTRPIEDENPPKNYSLVRPKAEYSDYNPQLQGSITGKDGASYATRNIDVDLSKGNYIGVYIEMPIKSLKLPETYKQNLTNLVLFSNHQQETPVEIKLGDYPNLDWCVIREMYTDSNGQFIRPNYLITDEVIDLPKCGALWLGGSDWSISTEFKHSELEIKPYSKYQSLAITSRNLNHINVNYEKFKWTQFRSEDEKFEYQSTLRLKGMSNLTGISFSNLELATFSTKSSFLYDFSANNFPQSSTDYILQYLDSTFTQSFYDTNFAYLNLAFADFGQLEPTFTNGSVVKFIEGGKYIIESVNGNDDFSNLGHFQSGAIDTIDFDGVGNSFPIVGYANMQVLFQQASTTGSGLGAKIEVSFDSSGNIDSYTIFAYGKNYAIDEVVTTDDPYSGSLNFKVTSLTPATVGEFIATGITPSNWTNDTPIFLGSNFGFPKQISFVSTTFTILDGHYFIYLSDNGTVCSMTFSSNSLVSYDILYNASAGNSSNSENYSCVGRKLESPGYNFAKWDEDGWVYWSGKDTDKVVFEVTEIYRNKMPTGGTANASYQSLISKNWNIKLPKA